VIDARVRRDTAFIPATVTNTGATDEQYSDLRIQPTRFPADLQVPLG
jgi:hypothetical protein